MKNNKGISLISLAVTIFILLLLASTIIISTRDSYSTVKMQNFISKMKIIQAKVDELSENESYNPPPELRISELNRHYNSFLNIFNSLKSEGKLSDKESFSDYYCFESSDLQNKLGIKNVNITVMINFKTRNVIAENGITIDGVSYYRQYDIDSGEKVLANYNENETVPNDIGTENETLKPVQSTPDGSITFSTNYGTIDVIWIDTSNRVIAEPNDPTSHLAGMTKVTWTENFDHSATEDETPQSNWYNYTSANGTADSRKSRWANAKNSDGSYFVWIPRFAYRITYYDNQNDRSDFLKRKGYYDGYGQWRISDGKVRVALDEGIETVEYNGKKYIVHPAFTNDSDIAGSKQPFDLGGWDSELEGFWFAKYEMSRNNATDSNAGSGTTFKSVHTVQSARNMKVGNIYNYSLAYDNSKESHLMKNSEWGAVAYLTHSQYGRNGNEIDINNSSSFITGNGGGSTSASGTEGITYIYNSANGTKASSTGNVYGIYDLSGNAWEYVAAFNSTDANNRETSNASSFASTTNPSTKYATQYNNTTSKQGVNAVFCRIGKIGEATKEVNKGGTLETNNETTSNYNWFNDSSGFAQINEPFFQRGGSSNHGIYAGIFCSGSGYGGTSDSSGFRVVLCP